MSRVNPKSKYAQVVGKAIDYLITRFESGTRFVATAANVDFTLPASDADANVVEMEIEVECIGDACTLAPTGTDVIDDNGTPIALISLNHEGDRVRLVCYEVGIWRIVSYSGCPLLDSKPINVLSVYEVTTTTYDVEEDNPYSVLHVTETATDDVAITLKSAWIAVDGNIITIKDTGLNASVKNISIVGEGGEDIEGDPAGALINGDGDSLTFQSFGGSVYIIGAKI